MSNDTSMHATTILTVRKAGKVVIAGDGQVSLGQTIMKGNARKVRRLGKGNVIAGFAGATAVIDFRVEAWSDVAWESGKLVDFVVPRSLD